MTILSLHLWPWWEVTRHGHHLFGVRARTRAEAIRLANAQLDVEGDTSDRDIDVKESPYK